MLLFSRGVNFQYVWREFWECDGCASSQLVRSNILQALFAAPLFKAFAFVIGTDKMKSPFSLVMFSRRLGAKPKIELLLGA